jgi:hypothetical protein
MIPKREERYVNQIVKLTHLFFYIYTYKTFCVPKTCTMSGISCRELRVYFGGVSGALITIMHKRVSEEAAKNRRFKRRVDKVKKRILNI